MHLKTISPILLLLAGSVAILPAATVAPEKESARPLQPFLVELLDQERGNWNFLNPLGQQLAHPGEVTVVAAVAPEKMKAAVLRLDNPEFPGDAKKAEFREFPAEKPGFFFLRTGGFQADLSLKPDGKGTLSNIRLGSAVEADRIPAALYVSDGTRMIPVRLEGKNGGFKLQSDRVGSVFAGDEPVKLHAVRLDGTPVDAEYIVTDYFRSREAGRGKLRLEGEDTVFTVPLEKFGSFTVELKLPEQSASLRVTRIPERQELDPEASFVGMNIFQQQTRYYSYQLPLFAKAGVRWVRPWLHWENTWKMQEPKEGVFDTGQLDALRRRMKEHGQKFVYILYNFSPALKLPSTQSSPLDDEQMKRWCEYVKRIVAHCGEVDDWEVWNEPDGLARSQNGFSVDFYKKLLRETAGAVRSVRPDARIHSLSHATFRPWLEELCRDTASAAVTDVVTLHTYAPVQSFVSEETMRQRILDVGGFCGKPQQFNEIGATAYDGCPAYTAAFPGSSERRQAEILPVNWAQALHFGGPQGKAYWFPSLDPRDSTNPEQRTGDSGYGLFYLGGKPKAAFAALAGMARMLDGSKCLGRMEIPDSPVRYVAFSGGRAVVWSDRREGTIAATALGCRPGEELTMYDLFGNPVGGGKAADLTLILDDGPRFLLGSARLGELAHAAREEWMRRRTLTGAAERQVGTPVLPELKAGERREFEFTVPEKSQVAWTTSRDFPAELRGRQEGARVAGEVIAGTKSGSGFVKFSIQLPETGTPVVNRFLPISVDRRNLIPDGSFELGTLDAFQLIPQVRYDGTAGSEAPGCLRFDSPLDGRLHLPVERPLLPKRALHFKAMVKGRLASGAKVSFNAAMFGKGGWLGTWMAAALRDNSPDGRKFRQFTAEIPDRIDEWTSLTATLPGARLPEGHVTLIFFIDCRDGAAGDFLLVDDLALWQDEAEEEGGEHVAIPWEKWHLQRQQGAKVDGNLLLEAPLTVRLHTSMDPSTRRFRLRVRSRLDAETQVKLALACFDGVRHLGDRVLAATQGNAVVRIPRQSDEWTELAGEIPALPEGCSRCLIFVDGTGGKTGSCEISPVELGF